MRTSPFTSLILVATLASSLAVGCASTPNSALPSASARYHPMLGSNVANREPVERSVFVQALLYLPDRILDLGDVFSFDVHVGIGALANVHVTRAMQSGAGVREVLGFGWHERRSLGFRNQGDANIFIPILGMEAAHVSQIGTSGIDSVADGTLGLIGPSDPLYQEYRDYWAVGAQVTAGVIGVDFDFHPVQFADFLLGWTTFDFLNDDFASTRGIDDDVGTVYDDDGVVYDDDHTCTTSGCNGLTCADLVTTVID